MTDSCLGIPMWGQTVPGYELPQANRCVEGMSHVMLVILPWVL